METTYRLVENVMLQLHSDLPPLESEWRKYAKVVGDCLDQGVPLRVLVVTRGGGPTATQRSELNQALRGRAVPTAVVTESMLARAIVSALTLFNPSIRAFHPKHADQAFAFLEVGERVRQLIRSAAPQMWRELGARPIELGESATQP